MTLADADAGIGFADSGLAPFDDVAGRFARRSDLDAVAAGDRLRHAGAGDLDAAMLDENGEGGIPARAGEEFRAALSRFPSGVTVVTTRDGEGRFHGITVSAFCSLSLEPPRVLICIEKTTGSHMALLESRAFVVNMLSAEQREISERFASLVENKFDETDFETGLDGIPVLLGCIATLERPSSRCAPLGCLPFCKRLRSVIRSAHVL